MRSRKIIHVISCHAEGEVGDVIIGGVAPPPGDTLWAQRQFLHDDINQSLPAQFGKGFIRPEAARAPARQYDTRHIGQGGWGRRFRLHVFRLHSADKASTETSGFRAQNLEWLSISGGQWRSRDGFDAYTRPHASSDLQ